MKKVKNISILLTHLRKRGYTEKTVLRFKTKESIYQAGDQPQYRNQLHPWAQTFKAPPASPSLRPSGGNDGLVTLVASHASCCCSLCQSVGGRWSRDLFGF